MNARLQLTFMSLMLLLWGCTEEKEHSSQTLLLSLSSENGRLQVVDYELRDNAFVKYQQQGAFQANIFDESGKVLQEINFEKIDLPREGREYEGIDFYVALPFLAKAERIEIYELDGRSGHYQLKTDDPLLNWSLPRDIK